MKCWSLDCNEEAITFHGVNFPSHGYCEEHRCCAKCGLRITKCDCESGIHTEREDYLEYLKTKKENEEMEKGTDNKIVDFNREKPERIEGGAPENRRVDESFDDEKSMPEAGIPADVMKKMEDNGLGLGGSALDSTKKNVVDLINSTIQQLITAPIEVQKETPFPLFINHLTSLISIVPGEFEWKWIIMTNIIKSFSEPINAAMEQQKKQASEKTNDTIKVDKVDFDNLGKDKLEVVK